MGKIRNRRTEMELNDKLRNETLKCILEARSTEYMADKFGVTEKAIKFRLTNLYKYYNVKSKYELMAKFVVIPDEVLLATVDQTTEVPSVSNKVVAVNEESAGTNEVKVGLPTGSTDNIWS